MSIRATRAASYTMPGAEASRSSSQFDLVLGGVLQLGDRNIQVGAHYCKQSSQNLSRVRLRRRLILGSPTAESV